MQEEKVKMITLEESKTLLSPRFSFFSVKMIYRGFDSFATSMVMRNYPIQPDIAL